MESRFPPPLRKGTYSALIRANKAAGNVLRRQTLSWPIIIQLDKVALKEGFFMSRPEVSVQLYSVREQLADNLELTLEKLA